MQFVAKVELFESAGRAGFFPAGGVLDPARAVRRDRNENRGADRRAGRHGRHLSRGNPDPRAGARRRPPRARDRAAVLLVAVHGLSRSAAAGGSGREGQPAAGKPITFPRTEKPSAALAATAPSGSGRTDAMGVAQRPAALAQGGGDRRRGVGDGVAVLLARGGLEVALGTRSEAKAERIRKHGENADYPPGVDTCGLTVKRSSEIEPAAATCPPLQRRRRTWSERSPTGSARAPRCCCSKGFVQPMGRCRTSISAACAPGRSLRSVVHAPASGRRDGGARPRQRRRRPAAMLGEVLDRAGWSVSEPTTSPSRGGGARRRRTLAAAAAERFGLNAAGIAAAGVARVRRVRPPAAPGRPSPARRGRDLTATVLAPKGRNRRAGELLGASVDKISARVGQASEGLDGAGSRGP